MHSKKLEYVGAFMRSNSNHGIAVLCGDEFFDEIEPDPHCALGAFNNVVISGKGIIRLHKLKAIFDRNHLVNVYQFLDQRIVKFLIAGFGGHAVAEILIVHLLKTIGDPSSSCEIWT